MLNEANEPEEEEDTYDTIMKQKDRLPAVHVDHKTEAGETILEPISEARAKKRAGKQVGKKIEAISALYGSDATVENIR